MSKNTITIKSEEKYKISNKILRKVEKKFKNSTKEELIRFLALVYQALIEDERINK